MEQDHWTRLLNKMDIEIFTISIFEYLVYGYLLISIADIGYLNVLTIVNGYLNVLQNMVKLWQLWMSSMDIQIYDIAIAWIFKYIAQ